jgi:hypothetical protein
MIRISIMQCAMICIQVILSSEWSLNFSEDRPS